MHSGLIQTAHHSRDHEEKQISPVGGPLFFPISDLNKHAYIKDDTMFVKVIVDCADL